MTTRNLTALICFCTISAWGVDKPRVGLVCDGQGQIHAIDGLPGNFIPGDTVSGDPALAFASNGMLSVRKTASDVEIWDAAGHASFPADPGSAVIGFDQSRALIYMKDTLYAGTSAGMSALPVALPLAGHDEVLALAGSRQELQFAVRRAADHSLAIVRFNQSDLVESRTIEPASNILLWTGGVLIRTSGSSITVTRNGADDWSVDTGSHLHALRQMGTEWIHIQGARKQFAVRIPASGEAPVLYQLPNFMEAQ